MAIEFYYGSGSPYAWRVWLALEHKALPYHQQLLSFSAGDLKKPGYLALNPRGRVPVIVDQGYALYESAAILEYLEDAYPAARKLFPADLHARATARRQVREADEYVAHAMEVLVEQVLFTDADKWDAPAIKAASERFVAELAHFEQALRTDFFANEVGAVDYTLYPMLALALRMQRKKPDLGIAAGIGPRLAAWMKRMEALPVYAATYPPHWK